ncbi:MAG: PEP-CTERM/exosortase system-associated acyltransferase [Candidatus Omnitrophota bacterium]|nr:PEP-CTERM/exosortase system-associated acyltransferase [Candidatus Omnitrophota bacterium]
MLNFTFKLVSSRELQEEIYRLRFQIYVKENDFISCEDCQDNKESDKFDDYSIHIAAIDKKGVLAGAVRLVLDSEYGFPMEKYCHYPLFAKYKEANRENIAEISRLVIRKEYRIGQWNDPYHVIIGKTKGAIKESKCTISPILFGLYGVAYQESKRRNITHWCAAMEDSLYNLVDTHGFVFNALGEPIEYYGRVVPYLSVLREIEKSLRGLKINSQNIFQKLLEPATA